MCPIAQPDRHDGPWPVDELVLGRGAMLKNVVVGGKTRLESQSSRMNCQMFSTGLSSGHLGGSGTSVMFGGTMSLSDRCQPAWSRTSTACAPGATAIAISAKCRFIAAMLQRGRTRAAPLPSLGQMAPK